jgi:hypothetical protein
MASEYAPQKKKVNPCRFRVNWQAGDKEQLHHNYEHFHYARRLELSTLQL